MQGLANKRTVVINELTLVILWASLHNRVMTKTTLDKVHWDLEQILPINEFDAVYAELEQALPEFVAWQKCLAPDMAINEFQEYFAWHTAFNEKLTRLVDRPALWESTDGKAGEPALLKSRSLDLIVKAKEASRPIGMWLKGKSVDGMPSLDDANATRLFASISGMEYVLRYSRSMARHTLGMNEEDIISHKDVTGVAVLTDLREMLETDFSYEMTVKGKSQKFETSEELKVNIYSPEPEVREAVYRALFTPYAENSDKFFKIYQAVVKDWAYEAKLRGYASPIAMRNADNQITDKAIEVLMEVCESEAGVYQGFFKWKAKRLGLDKLRRFDLYAPLAEAKSTYTYPEAVEMVLDTFAGFSKTFTGHARRILDENHVDSHPSKYKRSGAFCATIVPTLAPYVMLNFAGKSRDISTLAHELGHGVHSLYAADLPLGAQHPNLPLAETASTFAEMILFEKILQATTDKAEREALLAEKIADSYATIMRQTYFVKFEIDAHQSLPEGAGVEDLQAKWLTGLKQQFGDVVELDDIFKHEWSYIPHIVHTPFYCYAYSFGDLLSMSLYARYQKEGESFVPKIEAILAAGGSRDPKELLGEVGINIEDRVFWRGGFEIVKGWIAQLD